jgi:hypothetical protein
MGVEYRLAANHAIEGVDEVLWVWFRGLDYGLIHKGKDGSSDGRGWLLSPFGLAPNVYPTGVGEDRTRGHTRPADADPSGESGWVATDVAARAVRVSPRTIRRYIDQGKLKAKQQGKGVRREWLVSVDSLHALRSSRTTEEDVPEVEREAKYADSIADVLREMSARLESRAEEAAELRVRLELTERAQSTLEGERRRALQELEEERGLREKAERER